MTDLQYDGGDGTVASVTDGSSQAKNVPGVSVFFDVLATRDTLPRIFVCDHHERQ